MRTETVTPVPARPARPVAAAPPRFPAGRLAIRAGRLVGGFADAWLPRGCVLCGLRLAGDEHGLCGGCLDGLPGRHARRCAVCALARPAPGASCPACAALAPAFDRTFALGDYAAPLDRAVVAMKFVPERSLAIALGDALGSALRTCPRPGRAPGAPALVVPVPLSLERWLARGFNPAALIAARVARHLRLAAPLPLLKRLWHTDSQSTLDLRARRDNVDGVFDCDAVAGRVLAGRDVLLVDDVMTTGATLHAAADALKCAGAGAVHCAVLARTPEHRVVTAG